jgi:Tat protein translocase TatB subunit
MFELGGSLQEILLILVVALLVVGPKRLPEVGRMLVRAMRELRRASDEFRSTIETNLNLDAPAPRPSSTEPGVPTTSVVVLAFIALIILKTAVENYCETNPTDEILLLATPFSLRALFCALTGRAHCDRRGSRYARGPRYRHLHCGRAWTSTM